MTGGLCGADGCEAQRRNEAKIADLSADIKELLDLVQKQSDAIHGLKLDYATAKGALQAGRLMWGALAVVAALFGVKVFHP